ncbi:hypothetical protein DXG01_008166 [Tephrocybe rancida]|nr:hypothetical protein DXG01_008166 [Tephrocybe rancida]
MTSAMTTTLDIYTTPSLSTSLNLLNFFLECAMPTNDTPFFSHAPSGLGNAPGIRNYDYTFKYTRDKQGEGHKENARVWNVYLDEAEMYDTEMIQGFRNTIDGLLVFAALFSAIVTTFVAQTSQALQPDNAQIMASLLVETNLLLRAAGNVTTLNAVPHGLSPDDAHNCRRMGKRPLLWQPFAIIVVCPLDCVGKAVDPGKEFCTTRETHTLRCDVAAGVHSSCFWTCENTLPHSSFSLQRNPLPLIMHGSVVVFLVGLALYVSQISFPIYGVVSLVLVVTILFYFATSILSVVYIDSPFRVPILMNLAQWAVLVALILIMWLRNLLNWVGLPVEEPHKESHTTVIERVRVSPQDIEHNIVVHPHNFWHSSLTILDSLKWLVSQSTNQSVTEIVAEAALGLLMEENMKEPGLGNYLRPYISHPGPDFISMAQPRSFYCARYSELLHSCILSLEARILATDPTYDPNNVHIATWEPLIRIMFEAASDGYQIGMKAWPRFTIADRHLDNIALCKRILDWSIIRPEADKEFVEFSWHIPYYGGAAGARAFLGKFPKQLHESGLGGRTLFHHAARNRNKNVVAAILEDHPSIISIQAQVDDKTALENAAWHNMFDMVDFFLQRGAGRPVHLLHGLIRGLKFNPALSLLERGWSPFLKDESGTSAFEIANRLYHFEQGTLHHPDDQVEKREHQIHTLRNLLDKMKLIEGEQSKSESIDTPTVTLTTS